MTHQVLESIQCLTHCIFLRQGFLGLTNLGGGSSMMPNPLNSHFCIDLLFLRHYNCNWNLGSYLAHQKIPPLFESSIDCKRTLQSSICWFPRLVRVYKLDLSIISQFRYLHLCMNQLPSFVDNQSYFSREFPMQHVSKNMLSTPNCLDYHAITFLENFPFKKAFLAFDLIILRD